LHKKGFRTKPLSTKPKQTSTPQKCIQTPKNFGHFSMAIAVPDGQQNTTIETRRENDRFFHKQLLHRFLLTIGNRDWHPKTPNSFWTFQRSI
jgi:hypothetical protein